MTWYHDTSWQLTDPSVVKERWPGHRGSTARGWEGTHRDLDLERFEKQKPSLQGMLTTLPSVATVTWKMRGGSPFWPGVDCGGGLHTEAPWPLLRCMTITTELSTNATRSMPWMMSCMMSWCHAWPLDSEAPKASNSLVEHMRTAETVLVRNHLCFHCVHRAPCSFEGALLPSFSELRRRRGRLQWRTFALFALALAFIDVRQRMRLRLHWPSIFPKATTGNGWTPGFWVASCFFLTGLEAFTTTSQTTRTSTCYCLYCLLFALAACLSSWPDFDKTHRKLSCQEYSDNLFRHPFFWAHKNLGDFGPTLRFALFSLAALEAHCRFVRS